MNTYWRFLGPDADLPLTSPPSFSESSTELDGDETPVPGGTPPIGMSITAIRRRASVESGLLRSPYQVTYGQCSDIGMSRSSNEDSILSFFTTQMTSGEQAIFGLFVVADGAGGHHGGEVAAATATRVVVERINHDIYLPILSHEGYKFNHDPSVLLDHLTDAVKDANRAVMKEVPDGGTTLTTALLMGDSVYIAHAGDSRAYLIAHGPDGGEYTMERMTRDHSVARRLEEIGQITAEEAARHPDKNRLWKIIGKDAALEPDTTLRHLPADSYLLLCSDGLWGFVPEEDMLRIVLKAETPQAACEQLVTFANARGGEDNISAILVKIAA